MRTVQKKTTDETIRISRKYWDTGDVDILDARYNLTKKLSNQAFESEHKYMSFGDLIDSVLKLNKGATNELIYSVFELIGISVAEEEA